MKKLWLKISCVLTGWNYDILKISTEASRKQLKKYSAALIILMLVWGLVGYLFAARYVGLSWFACSIVTIAMIIVVLQIERQIILTVGSLGGLKVFRIIIAIVMAIIGSAIVDQIIFKDDIDKEMIKIVDEEVREQLPNRLFVIEEDAKNTKAEIDSLESQLKILYTAVEAQPVITTVSTTRTEKVIPQPDGSVKKEPEVTISKNPIANPKFQEIETINKNLNALRTKQDTLIHKKMQSETDLRAELNAKKGFLMELRAILRIIGDRTEALIFYLVLFVFLVSLELFVVFSKWGDHQCDYDIYVENEQKRRIDEIRNKTP